MRFVDTNVLLYAFSRDRGEARKQEIAWAIVTDPDIALSAQVLQEFYTQATRPSRPDPFTHRDAADAVTAFSRFPVEPITFDLIRAAIHASDRYQIAYWDAAIIEAARALGCDQLLSEDLAHGQDYGGVVVTNPFL